MYKERIKNNKKIFKFNKKTFNKEFKGFNNNSRFTNYNLLSNNLLNMVSILELFYISDPFYIKGKKDLKDFKGEYSIA